MDRKFFILIVVIIIVAAIFLLFRLHEEHNATNSIFRKHISERWYSKYGKIASKSKFRMIKGFYDSNCIKFDDCDLGIEGVSKSIIIGNSNVIVTLTNWVQKEGFENDFNNQCNNAEFIKVDYSVSGGTIITAVAKAGKNTFDVVPPGDNTSGTIMVPPSTNPNGKTIFHALSNILFCLEESFEEECIDNPFDIDDVEKWSFINSGNDSHSVSGGKLSISSTQNFPTGPSLNGGLFGGIYIRSVPSGFDQNNFSILVKMDTIAPTVGRAQGIVFANDSDTFIRFEVWNSHNSPTAINKEIYIQEITSLGVAGPLFLGNIGIIPAPIWLRVIKTGFSDWNVEYSTNGVTFNHVGGFPTFTSNMIVNQVGLHIRTFNAVMGPQAYTGIFDFIKDEVCLEL